MVSERCVAAALRDSCVFEVTAAQLADGSFLETLLQPSSFALELAHISPAGNLLTQGSAIEVCGCVYKPLGLSTSILNAVAWPSGLTNVPPSDSIHEELCRAFQSAGLDEPASIALTCFAIGTWFTDVLPQAPILVMECDSACLRE